MSSDVLLARRLRRCAGQLMQILDEMCFFTLVMCYGGLANVSLLVQICFSKCKKKLLECVPVAVSIKLLQCTYIGNK